MVEMSISTIPVLDAFEKAGNCPLCDIWVKNEDSYLEYVESNEVTMNPEFREKVIAASGFCNRHMHRLYHMAFSGRTENGLGYALYARDVIGRIEESTGAEQSDIRQAIRHLRSKNLLTKRRNLRKGFARIVARAEKAIQGTIICPICAMLQESDRRTIGTFLNMLEDEEFARVFAKSEGMCLPHFVSAMKLLPKSRATLEVVGSLMLEVELRKVKKVGHLLGERIRKYSWDYRNEKITNDEASSQENALKTLVGVEGLYCESRKVTLRLLEDLQG